MTGSPTDTKRNGGVPDDGMSIAFLELLEQTRDRVRARFDVITMRELEMVARTNSMQRNSEFMNLEPSVVTIDATGEARKELRQRFENRPLRESAWYYLKFGQGGLNAMRYSSLDSTEPTNTHILEGSHIDGRSAVGRQVRALFNLDDFPSATEEAFSSLLKPVLDTDLCCVAVYSVGQGNANAVCDVKGRPLLFFDLGGGCAWNAKTYPEPRSFDWSRGPGVVLSHWDFDHYFTATREQKAWECTWLVPYQRTLGPTARKLLATIAKHHGKVFVWRTKPWTFSCAPVTLVRPAPYSSSPNHGGIVMRVNANRKEHGTSMPILLTGDVGYHQLPASVSGNLRGLVASHHGASQFMGTPPASQGGHVVFSYGFKNTYGHPTTNATKSHRSAGWTDRIDTVFGDVVFDPRLCQTNFIPGSTSQIQPLKPENMPASLPPIDNVEGIPNRLMNKLWN